MIAAVFVIAASVVAVIGTSMLIFPPKCFQRGGKGAFSPD
jgi:hypothetical protein